MKTLDVPNALAALYALEGPLMVATSPEGEGHIAYLDFAETQTLDAKAPGPSLAKLTETRSPMGLSFSGWVGFLGYEFLVAHLGITLGATRDLPVPDGFFARPQTILWLRYGNVGIESTLPGRESELSTLLADAPALPQSLVGPADVTCNLSFEEYAEVFDIAREAILNGETYQIKISQRHEARTQIDPIHAFCSLNAINPSPEAFLLRHPEFAIVSCSPETVIDKQGNRIVTRPIGGTYERRSDSDERDVISRFLSDPKEVSEHNMLVDLERNDLSTVCLPGTVHIARFREVETYAHLYHLVSTIEGRLRPNTDLSSILRAMLPGGTITGCPKVRTIELIDSLEPCFRGPYTGSFGTIGDNGSLHLNLIIRSLLVFEDCCFAQAGGGIVANSTPEYEYNENGVKARALLDLL